MEKKDGYGFSVDRLRSQYPHPVAKACAETGEGAFVYFADSFNSPERIRFSIFQDMQLEETVLLGNKDVVTGPGLRTDAQQAKHEDKTKQIFHTQKNLLQYMVIGELSVQD